MAGNKFELQQVLNYRREIERVRKQEFASAKMQLEEANEQLRREEECVEGLAEEFRSRQQEMSSIDEMRMYANYFVRKKDEIRSRKEQVESLGDALNDCRETLLDATKDKKVLESLKEKKAKQFRQKIDQKEREFMDELSIQKKVE